MYVPVYEKLYLTLFGWKVYTKNLQKLMLQIYNCLSEENPSFMGKLFEKREIKYELRIKNLLQTPNVKRNTIGANSLNMRDIDYNCKLRKTFHFHRTDTLMVSLPQDRYYSLSFFQPLSYNH